MSTLRPLCKAVTYVYDGYRCMQGQRKDMHARTTLVAYARHPQLVHWMDLARSMQGQRHFQQVRRYSRAVRGNRKRAGLQQTL